MSSLRLNSQTRGGKFATLAAAYLCEAMTASVRRGERRGRPTLLLDETTVARMHASTMIRSMAPSCLAGGSLLLAFRAFAFIGDRDLHALRLCSQ